MGGTDQIWQDHHYRSADDRLDLYARDYRGPEGAPVLLMLHGLTRSSKDFDAIAAHLADRYRIIVPDQRGRGLSAYDPEPKKYHIKTYIADMVALLDGLGIASAVLIGTSMGGLMTMVMGASMPDRVKAMVINDIGPVVEQAGIDRIKSYMGKGKPVTDWDSATDYCALTGSDTFPDYTREDWLAMARRIFVEADGGGLRINYDPAISQSLGGDSDDKAAPQSDLWGIWDKLSDIPALVVRGETTDLFSVETMQEMERRHPKDFAHVTVPRIGHAPMLDEPEALAAIEAFLAEFA
jgi:pimeloyl-ACP methyl ester carboxylesterase